MSVVGDEFRCSVCVFCVDVRPHQAAVAEDAGANGVQVGCSCTYLVEEFLNSSGQGRFTSEQVNILYSGREEHHYQGVGIMLNIEATKALVGWKPVNERIITARLCTKHAKVAVVQVYAPTESASDGEKDLFCDQLYSMCLTIFPAMTSS